MYIKESIVFSSKDQFIEFSKALSRMGYVWCSTHPLTDWCPQEYNNGEPFVLDIWEDNTCTHCDLQSALDSDDDPVPIEEFLNVNEETFCGLSLEEVLAG